MNRRRFVLCASSVALAPALVRSVSAQTVSQTAVGDYKLSWTSDWKLVTQEGATTSDGVPYGGVESSYGGFQLYVFPSTFAKSADDIATFFHKAIPQFYGDKAGYTYTEADRWTDSFSDGERVSSLHVVEGGEKPELVLVRAQTNPKGEGYVATVGMFLAQDAASYLDALTNDVSIDDNHAWADVQPQLLVDHLGTTQATVEPTATVAPTRAASSSSNGSAASAGDGQPDKLQGHTYSLADGWKLDTESSSRSSSETADAIAFVKDPYAVWVYAVPYDTSKRPFSAVRKAFFSSNPNGLTRLGEWDHAGQNMGTYTFKTTGGDQYDAFQWMIRDDKKNALVAMALAPKGQIVEAIKAIQSGVTIDKTPLMDGVDTKYVQDHMKK